MNFKNQLAISLVVVINLALIWRAGGLSVPQSQQDMRTDITPPGIAFFSPRQGQTLSYLPTVSGWVRDNPGGSGVARIIVRLQRKTRGSTFRWEGYEWHSPDGLPKEDWWYFADIVGNRWSYGYLPTRYVQSGGMGTPSIGPKLFSGMYKLTATAYDHAGNHKSTALTIRVVADRTLPTVAFSWPRSGAIIGALTVIKGWAADRGGSGLNRVEISIWRHSDGKWWTGKVWAPLQSAVPPRLLAILSKGRWHISQRLPKGANLISDKYSFWAFAYDHAGNQSGLTAPGNEHPVVVEARIRQLN